MVEVEAAAPAEEPGTAAAPPRVVAAAEGASSGPAAAADGGGKGRMPETKAVGNGVAPAAAEDAGEGTNGDGTKDATQTKAASPPPPSLPATHVVTTKADAPAKTVPSPPPTSPPATRPANDDLPVDPDAELTAKVFTGGIPHRWTEKDLMRGACSVCVLATSSWPAARARGCSALPTPPKPPPTPPSSSSSSSSRQSTRPTAPSAPKSSAAATLEPAAASPLLSFPHRKTETRPSPTRTTKS